MMPARVINLPGEVWASIEGFPGYWVSSEGRVRSRRGVLKPHQGNRYGHLTVELPGKQARWIHRLVAGAFLDNPNGLPIVMHGDDDPSHNEVGNLSWGTYAQNMADARARGRFPVRQEHHGTRSEYQFGCRCPACVAANTAYDRHRRESNPRFVEQQRAAKRRYYARQKIKHGASDD